jgi:Uma2 family endonuclease
MSAQPRLKMTVEEYLEFERNSDEKHEYFDGEVWLLHREPLAMAGAKPNHNLIAANIIAHLSPQVEAQGCRIFTSDQKLKLPSGLYTYPDVTLVCGKPEYDEEHPEILLNPTLIIEVLSPKTEAYDRGKKLRDYQTLQSLQTYVLIAQDAYRIETYTRMPSGLWVFENAIGIASKIALPAVEAVLSLERVYRYVEIDGQ